MLATSQAGQAPGLHKALERWLRPAVGFSHPCDVLKDPLLDREEKRAILASWASDASAVEDRPHLRWLFGTEEPVALDDVLECLARLDRSARQQGEIAVQQAPIRKASKGTEADDMQRPFAHGGGYVFPKRVFRPVRERLSIEGLSQERPSPAAGQRG